MGLEDILNNEETVKNATTEELKLVQHIIGQMVTGKAFDGIMRYHQALRIVSQELKTRVS